MKKTNKASSGPSKLSEIEKRIRPVGEIPSFQAALIYGRAATGKTTVAATFPKPLLLLDIREKGTETIAKVSGIDVFSVRAWRDLEDIYWLLESGKHKYQTVVLDQISTLQGIAMSKIREDDDMEPDEVLSKRQWGQISGLMQTWLLNYRDLWDKNLHVVFIAHERADEGEETLDDQLDPTIGPRVMPSLQSFITGAVSMIGNTFIRERQIQEGPKKTRKVEYCMRIGPHAYYVTKIRKPPDGDPAPGVIVNPSFEKLVRLSRGEGISKKVDSTKRK